MRVLLFGDPGDAGGREEITDHHGNPESKHGLQERNTVSLVLPTQQDKS